METPRIIQQYQIAVFPEKTFNIDSNRTLQEIRDNMDIFNNSKYILVPVPIDAPRGIFRIILKSTNEEIECQISLDKIDIFFKNPDVSTNPNYKKEANEIKEIVGGLLGHVLKDTKTIRVGYIVQFVFESDNPVLEVSKKILNESKTEDLTAFTLQLTNKAEAEVHKKCNHVFTIRYGKNKKTEKKLIGVMSDFNTSQDSKISWNKEKVETFIEQAYKKSDKDEIYKRLFND